MRNSPPELLPEGRRTRRETPPPARRPRRRPLWALLSALTLVGGAACVGGWLGALLGLWAGRATGFLRLGFSTGLTLGTTGGLILAGVVALLTERQRR
jgi:hypothetical protein